MNIEQFRYSRDNFGYVVSSKGMAMAIDPGAVSNILSYVKSENLNLALVANTHMHPDHVTGTQDVIDASGARYLDNETLQKTPSIHIGGEDLQVIQTPGHTHDSLCFHTPGYLISGDTLFNGTVGACFSGDLEAFYKSVKKLMELPPETIVYAGHDYVREAMVFAKHIEPNNPAFDEFLKKHDPRHVFSTIKDEMSLNPYFRFNDPAMIKILEEKGLDVSTEYERWESLMHVV